jgi:hypothetical protein
MRKLTRTYYCAIIQEAVGHTPNRKQRHFQAGAITSPSNYFTEGCHLRPSVKGSLS